MLRQAGGFRRRSASLSPRQSVEFERQRTFWLTRIKRVKAFGGDEPQTGSGGSKREAEQDAARKMLVKLGLMS